MDGSLLHPSPEQFDPQLPSRYHGYPAGVQHHRDSFRRARRHHDSIYYCSTSHSLLSDGIE
jgi:hypothetical protein